MGFRIGDREKGKKLDSGVKPLMKLEKYCIYNFHQNEDGFVYVYTDGSWEGNGTAAACAGLGVYFGEGHTLNAVSGRATNNCREFQAAALAIRLAKQQGITVKNQVDVEELDRELADKSIKIKWSHVDVDCGILGNERADALARESSAIFRRQKVNR